MDPASTLIGLAEVSLALAGFAAIVLVLGTRGDPFDADVLAVVRVMISTAVGSAFISLIGVAILGFQIQPPFAWRLLSAIAFAAIAAGSALNIFLFLRGAPRTRAAVLWLSLMGVATAVHLANALGLLGLPSFGLFLLGFVTLLGLAGIQFVYVVYVLLGRSAV
jgi:hypothetical protein